MWLAVGLALGIAGARVGSAEEVRPVPDGSKHWAFQKLPPPTVPTTGAAATAPTPVDRFLAAHLERAGLSLGDEAPRPILIRRVALVVTGLPPTPEEIARYLQDTAPGAYERMMERYLASPRYGERWGKHWLDAAGYADSNGYFSADSDRPLAYRYRDYVIRSLNRDKPLDQFIREQLAGDELAQWKPGQPATPEIIELLEATHFLRNGQDGSGESDGNPDEVRVDRYYALDSAMQIIGSSLLGVTVQCSKCHDHKFEPITQKDYYALQAVLYPAFNVEKWVKPNDRVVTAALPGEMEAWEARQKQLNAEEAALKQELNNWVANERVPGAILFEDHFDSSSSLSGRWSNTAPGDDTPGGQPEVQLDTGSGPAAQVKDGALRIIEGGGSGDRWISTRLAFSWRPPRKGDWIQATFDLVATRLNGQGNSAERVGYLIALHDFNDNSTVDGGNILIDGHPSGASSVQIDYPGTDAAGRGAIGATGYTAGRNYGVRVTNLGNGQFSLEHLADRAVDGASIKLKAEELPTGGFGFEYCCGRSFIVDNVVVEASRSENAAWVKADETFQKALAGRKKEFDERLKEIASRRSPKPGRIAWVTDLSAEAPVVPLLKRGNPKTPGEAVDAATPVFLSGGHNGAAQATPTATSTGRRLAWARWLTEPDSPQAGLFARVTVNRMWADYFGAGLVATTDNLGLSGAKPANRELLDWLAGELVRSDWSLKAVHRVLLKSAAFQQSSAPRPAALAKDPDNHLLWRYPLRRLDAEAIRDAMIAVADRLGSKSSGPYVPATRTGAGETVVAESPTDALARSIYLQQRRTQVPTFLSLFDAPSIVFNCTRRAETTMPLQSLSLLNSDFALQRAEDFARRLAREVGPDLHARIQRAYLIAVGHAPAATTLESSARFLAAQRELYGEAPEAAHHAWTDFCQTLLASNEFLHLE